MSGIPSLFIHVPNHFNDLHNTADCILHIIDEISQQDLRTDDFKISQVCTEDVTDGINHEIIYMLKFHDKQPQFDLKYVKRIHNNTPDKKA